MARRAGVGGSISIRMIAGRFSVSEFSATFAGAAQTLPKSPGKYPPAKPGALKHEPLKAATGDADAAPNR